MSARLLSIVSVASFLYSGMNAVVGQALVVVPPQYAAVDAPVSRILPGISEAHRQQVVIDQALLGSIHGRPIHALVFRRDSRVTGALTAASANLVVRLGQARHPAASTAPDFTASALSWSEVFRGVVHAPDSPALAGGTAGFGASDTIRIDLAAPFVLAAGGLVIDIEGLDSALANWPIDAASDGLGGTVHVVGVPCRNSFTQGENASVGEDDLVLGRTSIFQFVTEPGASTWCMFGLSLLPTPLNLAMLGSADCWLWVEPITSVQTVSRPLVVPSAFPRIGISDVALHWPSDPVLSGVTVHAQWLMVDGVGFATSNALSCTLASTQPSLGMANLDDRGALPPRVQSVSVPIVAFEVD